MANITQRKAEQNHKKRRRNRIRQRIVGILGCLVVFVTTYALILPAITMEKECELEEHIHDDSCYAKAEEKALICTEDALGGHVHVRDCYDEENKLQCGQADFFVHSHVSHCYDADGKLVCPLKEIEEHTHDDSCYTLIQPTQGHVHTDACYQTERGDLTCQIHVHDTSCYIRGGLTCRLPEESPHAHGEGCTTRTLTCTLSTEPHTHTDDCYQWEWCLEQHVHTLECALPKLVCGLSEEGHAHSDACYQTEYLCGLTEAGHLHGDACYEKVLTCTAEGVESHTHADSCYAEQKTLTCGQEEAAAVSEPERVLSCGKDEIRLHSHGDSCYETYLDENLQEQKRLVCEETVVLEHVHGDACFQAVTGEETLSCTLEESQGHTHDDSCRDAAGNLTCTLEESQGHTHTARCYGTWELICGKEEHTHTIECSPAHTHGDSCYDETGKLICTIVVPESLLGDVPACDCSNSDADMLGHADSCAKKSFFKTLAEEKTAEELYAVWNEIPADAQNYILTYMEWNSYQYQDKLEELKGLIEGDSSEIETELEGGVKFAVAGDLPENAQLKVEDPKYEPDYTFSFLNPNIWTDVHDYWVYDIAIQVEGEEYQPDEPVMVTVSSPEFTVEEEEFFAVAHLDPENGKILNYTYVEVVDNSVTFEAEGFSPYLFYTVDKNVEGGERVWGTNWMKIKDSGFVTYWQQFMTDENQVAATQETPELAMFANGRQVSSAQQIANAGGEEKNVNDGISVSKTIAGTELENVFDITLKVQTNSSIQQIFQEPDMAVVLVMDISATMREDLGDKTKYEAAMLAAEEFVDQFQANNQGASKIGYVAFNTDGHKICDMQSCNTVAQATAFKNEMRTNTGSIILDENYKNLDTRYTNMEAGLTMAKDMLATTQNAHQYIIFLSDGLPTTYLQSGYTGYTPKTASGSPTPNTDGVFYDRINGIYVRYGTNYSDKGAQRAQNVATDLKNDGVTVFSVGVGVDNFTAYPPNGTVTLNSTDYINNQLDRGGAIGDYAGKDKVATIDNYVTDRSQLVVGDITKDAAGDVFKTWLKNKIGSGYYYNSANTTELQNVYAAIFEELTRLNIEASSSLWTVDDPIPLSNGSPETVEYIGLWNKAKSELDPDDKLEGSYIQGGENTANFDIAKQLINWDLKHSGFIESGTSTNKTYTYSLSYRVRLQNENEDPAFVEDQVYQTNGRTFLRYQTLITINGQTSMSEPKELEFPIPAVKGWLGELEFIKVDSEGNPLPGAEFILTHDTETCSICRGNETAVSIRNYTATSDEQGKVLFTKIPSGHCYNLTESKVPDGYTTDNRTYKVQVAYDVVTVTVYDSNGEEVTGGWNGTIVNRILYELPDTGGMGTTVYTMSGLLLATAALLALMYSNKRRKGAA